MLRILLKESFLVIKCKLICRKPKKTADQKHSSQPCKLTFDMIFVLLMFVFIPVVMEEDLKLNCFHVVYQFQVF